MDGKLYLIPVTLGSTDYNYVIPARVLEQSVSLRKFIVEDVRSARRYLRMIDPEFPIDDCEFMILNKHTRSDEIESMLTCLRQGHDAGLMSEAGIPAVADPGSKLVMMAHSNGFRVIPLTGPSSIFLALMSSGLNGQNFAFNGYLPIDRADRVKEIKKLEKKVRGGQSQIFMETPYRNMKLLHDIAGTLNGSTYLCIAANISLPGEFIMTRTVSGWLKSGFPHLEKKPAIFIIGEKQA
ncbi:MAG TPA: SAM-dependent methyltransferase [Bacteroidetes bacterium]|nr:SAM-dependent methyltransferase [Bacteroidota bacterium]